MSRVDLTWSNQPAGNVDIYRNGAKILSNRAGRTYTDAINSRSAATYTHKVCTTGTSTCSNTTSTAF